MTLSDIHPGEKCAVLFVKGKGALRRRIFDMGITPGTEILVTKTAPFGDPVEIKIRGYKLSLRKADAAMIEVEDI